MPIIFDSVLELTYDAGAVNNATFSPDGPAVHIPLYIKYKIDVPNNLLRPPFRILKTYFLFQRLFIPAQQCLITPLNTPDWAAISITPTNPFIEISNQFKTSTAILSIAVHWGAPAQAYNLHILAETFQLGRISANSAELQILFCPQYIPLLEISCDQPYFTAPPNQTTYNTLEITNLGNAETLVTINVTQIPGWSLFTDPTQLMIDVGNTKPCTVIIRPPADFHEEQAITLSFTPSHLGQVGTPVSIVLHAHYP